MSEYQYYEWQTIDRPLTSQERTAVNRLSSHIDVTSTRAQVDYSWGDFKHDPMDVLADYFDAYLYIANWGSRELAFRFPQDLLQVEAIQPYLVQDYVTLERRKGRWILAFDMADEDDWFDWIEPGSDLSDFASLRGDILRGDYRVLYLAWLRGMEILSSYEEEEEELEPPVPAGLGKLTAPLQTFVNWSGLDAQLLKAAQKDSPAALSAAHPPSETDWKAGIAQLSREECESFLLRLVADEAHLSLALRRRLTQEAGSPPLDPSVSQRTLAELIKTQETLREAESQRRAEAARKKQEQTMADLAQREEAIWHEVETRLAGSYKPKDYDFATAELARLHQLAVYRQSLPTFQRRFDALIGPYRGRSSLMARLERVGIR